MRFTKDALYYANKIREGKMTSVQLVEAALENIESLNNILNAVTNTQAESSLARAQRLDDALNKMDEETKEHLAPFYGVPILLKDLGQNQANFPSTSGSKLFKNSLAQQTDNFVKKIEENGFVIVGRTNTPEFGFKNISDSKLHGDVKSPIDLSRNPGGSSGGAASALKAGIVPIVTASDGGGSIRIPASFNGLIGLKPTRGRIPVGPGSYRGWQGASINFALTKSVHDTFTLLKGMQIEQFESPFILPKMSVSELEMPKEKFTIAYTLESPIGSTVSDKAIEAVKLTINHLKELGHHVIQKAPEVDGIKAMESYYKMNGVETAKMMASIESALQRAMSIGDMELMSWALYRSGLTISGVEYSAVINLWDDLTVKSEAFFSENNIDFLLMPTTNDVAPLQHQFQLSSELSQKLTNIDAFNSQEQQTLIWKMFEDSLEWTPFTQQQNLTGQPAISLPIYETSAGLPLGVQFSSSKGNEYKLLQLALQLETAGAFQVEIV